MASLVWSGSLDPRGSGEKRRRDSTMSEREQPKREAVGASGMDVRRRTLPVMQVGSVAKVDCKGHCIVDRLRKRPGIHGLRSGKCYRDWSQSIAETRNRAVR